MLLRMLRYIRSGKSELTNSLLYEMTDNIAQDTSFPQMIM